MTPWDGLAILGAGGAAGAINAVVGSGTLVTFPTLIALGYPALTANVSNTVGLVPGSAAGVWAYRRELRGQMRRLMVLAPATAAGAALGAVLLLALPEGAFGAVVPVLIALACLLVLLAPRLTAWFADRSAARSRLIWLTAGVGATGIYGGYFGAGQGIVLFAFLATFLAEDLQRLNGIKNVLAMLANLVAGLLFIALADIEWSVAGLIAAGSVVGGLLGGRYGRRLSPKLLRGLIVLLGVTAIVGLV